MNSIQFADGSSIEIRQTDEIEYYIDDQKITNPILIYEIEQAIDARTNNEKYIN